MRRLSAALLALVMALSLFACDTSEDDLVDALVSLEPTAEPSTGPQIIIPVGSASIEAFGAAYSSTVTLNPITGSSGLNLELAPLMYQGLFELTPDFRAEPVLCSTYSYNGDVWMFTLRRGVKMSDGEPLTAADVKYSLDLARSTERYASRLAGIMSVAAADDYTVMITTNGEYGRLELLLDIPIIRADSGDMYAPPGSGMYEFVEDEDSSYLRTTEKYRGKTTIARIQLVDTPEAELMISGFEQGIISVTSDDPTATDHIDYGGDHEEWSFPTTRMVYVAFGAQTDAAVRKILAGAIDREQIANTNMLDAADPADRPVNPASPQGREVREFSIKRSMRELADLGAVADDDGILRLNGQRLAIRLITPEENACKLAAARRIADDWRQLGFDVMLDELSFAEFKSALVRGEFDAALCETQLAADFAIDSLVAFGGALSYGGHPQSEELDALLAAYRAADDEHIDRAANALYNYLDRNVPISAVAFKRNLLIARRGAVGAPDPSAHNIYRGVDKW